MENRIKMGAQIIGSGMFLPPFTVTNADLLKLYPSGRFVQYGQDFDWGSDWIERKLGIRERRFGFDLDRRIMRDGLYDLDMGEQAARAALNDAGISIEDIDLIIYITSTPERYLPDPACELHTRLAAREDTAAFGLTSVGCGGFIYGMANAYANIASGNARAVLLVASLSTSAYMSQYGDAGLDKPHLEALLVRDRINASFFGDGAGAIVMCQNQVNKEGILHYYTGASGIGNPVEFKAGGSRWPATTETVLAGMHFFNMNVQQVKQIGPTLFEKTVHKVLKKSNMSITDMDYFIFHQVNYRMLKVIAGRLNIPWNKMSVHVDRYGNLDTATLAVGFHEAKSAGKIKTGDLVLFAAIGAGWQYGSMIVRI